MIHRLTSFIKKPTSLNIIINTLGNYLNVFFTALFALILVRILNPDQYGVLSVLLGIAYVLANILDFGTTATIYSYLPVLIENKAFNTYRFIKTTFFYQSLFSSVIIGILFLLRPSHIPVSSILLNWLVKGKKADNAFVVMFLLAFNWSMPRGRIDL